MRSFQKFYSITSAFKVFLLIGSSIKWIFMECSHIPDESQKFIVFTLRRDSSGKMNKLQVFLLSSAWEKLNLLLHVRSKQFILQLSEKVEETRNYQVEIQSFKSFKGIYHLWVIESMLLTWLGLFCVRCCKVQMSRFEEEVPSFQDMSLTFLVSLCFVVSNPLFFHD